ncbi:hypothetical protein ACO22_03012 [Paracoccidioides brasiliensis]|uniref:DUF676 domain-containing protein n=1 Tax=Paracoccidioides brasiliensis TaxID=121759 RepID=A0A1D2JH19_PARBR|nr:hypothetical protein ACO22_03012 [Paracoccidioides brasiliensis]
MDKYNDSVDAQNHKDRHRQLQFYRLLGLPGLEDEADAGTLEEIRKAVEAGEYDNLYVCATRVTAFRYLSLLGLTIWSGTFTNIANWDAPSEESRQKWFSLETQTSRSGENRGLFQGQSWGSDDDSGRFNKALIFQDLSTATHKRRDLILLDGGDDTFGSFPAHLRTLVSHALPDVEATSVVYPKYETKGDLTECVAKFREWLQNVVIDIEVANEAPSPTVDPSVHVILIGHSMGGIVGAETLLLLASEQLLPTPSNLSSSRTSSSSSTTTEGKSVEPNTFMFPHIQGLLAFDTPFLGIAPGVVSYTAENHYKTATAAYGAISEVAGVFGWGGAKKGETKAGSSPTTNENTKSSLPALPPTTNASSMTSPTDDAAATPSWQRWGRYAMYAGAAGAVAAGGAAALYSQRDKFLGGWSWATSHLEFVGCLTRPDELRRRIWSIEKLQQERGIGCGEFYTCLGQGAVAVPANSGINKPSPTFPLSRYILRSKLRTFCNIPADVDESDHKADDDKVTCSETCGIQWIKAINDKATDETKAHMSMFSPRENPSFYDLAQQASELLVRWIDRGWYLNASRTSGGGGGSSSSTDRASCGDESNSGGEKGRGFTDADDDVVLVD